MPSVTGDLAVARAIAREEAEGLAAQPGGEAALLHLSMRFGHDPAPVADRLGELAPMLADRLLARFADDARARADHDVDGLVAVAEAYESDGQWLLAAESRLAAAALVDGPDGRGHQVHADDLLSRCTGVASPTVDHLRGPSAGPRAGRAATRGAGQT